MSRRKTIWITVLVALAAFGLGGWSRIFSDRSADKPGVAASRERQPLYWVDPMHPKYKSDKPGTAPDCGMDLVPVYENQSTDPGAGQDRLKIPTGKQQLMGIRHATVIQASMTKTLRATGRIAYDETRIARVHPKIEGWIEKVYVDFTGKLIKKDEPLVDIYSPELVSTQQEFLLAAKARDHLASNSFKEISSAALSLYESSRKRLLLWDVDEQTIDQIEKTGKPTKAVPLYAPVGGFILERKAFEGQRITPETELYVVADLSSVWVIADVYEYEIQQIRLGQQARIELSYIPAKTFHGIVDYIYPQLEPSTRTLKVRIQVPNLDYALKLDMYAGVTFQIPYGNQTMVPTEAVLDSGAEQVVFVAHENGFFEPRNVKVGAEADGHSIVLEGLKPGERVVTSGNFLIDSESRLKSAMRSMEGMGHETSSGKASPADPGAKKPTLPAGPKQAPRGNQHKH